MHGSIVQPFAAKVKPLTESCKVVLTFEYLNEILQCHRLNESSSGVLYCGTNAVQSISNF